MIPTSMGMAFRSSSRCSKGACVEVSPLTDGGAVLRSTRNPTQLLALTAAEWADLLASVKAGALDTT